MLRRILLIDDFHPALQQGLESAGFTVIDERDCRGTLSDVCSLLTLHKPEGLMVRSKLFMGAEMMKDLPSQRDWYATDWWFVADEILAGLAFLACVVMICLL